MTKDLNLEAVNSALSREVRKLQELLKEADKRNAELVAENDKLRAALERAAHELELLYFFAISNGITKEGIPPHVQARAALTQETRYE